MDIHGGYRKYLVNRQVRYPTVKMDSFPEVSSPPQVLQHPNKSENDLICVSSGLVKS